MHGGIIAANPDDVQLLAIRRRSLLAPDAPPSQNELGRGNECFVRFGFRVPQWHRGGFASSSSRSFQRKRRRWHRNTPLGLTTSALRRIAAFFFFARAASELNEND
jgi:hypothetical protein